MSDITMNTVIWWIISVVIVGILINLASDYLKPYTDEVLGRYFATRKLATEERQAKFDQEVDMLSKYPAKVFDTKIDIIRYSLNLILKIIVFITAIQVISRLPDMLAISGFHYLAEMIDYTVNFAIIFMTLPFYIYLRSDISKISERGKILDKYYQKVRASESHAKSTPQISQETPPQRPLASAKSKTRT
jgi:hypothetical protein